MKAKIVKYEVQTIDDQGKVVTKTVAVDEVDTPQIKRCEELAKCRPGEVVLGLVVVKEGQVTHESERYLSDCTTGGQQ